MSNQWKRFGKEPLSGVFWVFGTYPEYDVDVDDYGKTTGQMTGESIEFISLVEIDFDPEPDGCYEIQAVGPYATGDFSDEYGISHYMEYEAPEPPIVCPECKATNVKETCLGAIDDEKMGGLSPVIYACQKCSHQWSDV